MTLKTKDLHETSLLFDFKPRKHKICNKNIIQVKVHLSKWNRFHLKEKNWNNKSFDNFVKCLNRDFLVEFICGFMGLLGIWTQKLCAWDDKWKHSLGSCSIEKIVNRMEKMVKTNGNPKRKS